MGLRRLFRALQLLLCALIATLAGVALDAGEDHPERTALQPGKPMDYHDLAFYPERWQQAQVSTRLIPWVGRNVVFLTTTSQFDAEVMGRFVGRLDAGWKLYAELTGRSPQPFRQWDGKPTIAAVPDAALTCGYGCGYVGATGMEIGGFYDGDYPLAKRDPEAFAHYYFYEMGRNYYTFGDRHSLFITGYAVFMRYVCMDALHCTDPDRSTRQTIETCESLYASSTVPFLTAFTNLSDGEKGHRLTDHQGQPVVPSDQPVMYATAMLKLHKDHGGDAWVAKFFRHLQQCPEISPDTEAHALAQSLNWLVAASCAAGKDLTPVFVDRWRMPLDPATRETLHKVDWASPGLDAAQVIKVARQQIVTNQ